MISLLKKIEENSYKLLKFLISLILVIILLLVMAQIVSRYFNIQALKPPDEIMTLTFTWFVFVGSALLVRDKDHLKIGLFDDYLDNKPRLKYFYSFIVGVLILIFLVVLTKSGVSIYGRAGSRTSPMLQLPQRIWYASMVVSGFMMIFYTVINMLSDLYNFIMESK